jgi:hypothetical protein
MEDVLGYIREQKWSIKEFIRAYVFTETEGRFHDSRQQRLRKLSDALFNQEGVFEAVRLAKDVDCFHVLSIEQLQTEVHVLMNASQFKSFDVETALDVLDIECAVNEVVALAPGLTYGITKQRIISVLIRCDVTDASDAFDAFYDTKIIQMNHIRIFLSI